MTSDKIGELFGFIAAAGQVAAQERFDRAGNFAGGNIAEQLAADFLARAKSAADEEVISLDHVRADFRAKQADVADEMLCTGMRAAGEVDVDGNIKRQSLVESVGDLRRVPLGVGGGEPAAGVARAGHDATADVGGRMEQSELIDFLLHDVDLMDGDVSDEQILPDREAQVAASVRIGDVGKSAH